MEDRRAFALVATAAFLVELGYYLTASPLPLYLSRVGVPDVRIGLDVGLGSVASIAVACLGGPFLDRDGPKVFFIAGSTATFLAAILMLLVPSEGALAAGRVLQGIGGAMVVPAASAAVPLLAPRRIGAMVGIMGTITALPLAVGPAVGLFLYQEAGPAGFLVPAVVTGAAGIVTGSILRLPHRRHQTTLRFVYERRWTAPLVATALNGIYFGGILSYLPIALTKVNGPSAGIFFAAYAGGLLLCRFPAGVLVDRYGSKLPMLLGVAITLMGLIALIPGPAIPWLLAAGAATGAGAGLFANGVYTHVLLLSDDRSRGTSMTLLVASLSTGVFVGGALSGFLFGPAGLAGVAGIGIAGEMLVAALVVWGVKQARSLSSESRLH